MSERFADVRRRLVDMANANDAMMDGTITPVLELIAMNDVVFGVWQDSTAPDGVGMLIIKGANRMREIAAIDARVQCTVTAIKCGCAEQAEALRQHVGADRTH